MQMYYYISEALLLNIYQSSLNWPIEASVIFSEIFRIINQYYRIHDSCYTEFELVQCQESLVLNFLFIIFFCITKDRTLWLMNWRRHIISIISKTYSEVWNVWRNLSSAHYVSNRLTEVYLSTRAVVVRNPSLCSSILRGQKLKVIFYSFQRKLNFLYKKPDKSTSVDGENELVYSGFWFFP